MNEITRTLWVIDLETGERLYPALAGGDNVVLNTSDSGGATIATDTVSSAEYQYVKIAFGANNTANIVTDTTTNPFPTDMSDRAARDLGKVDIAALDNVVDSGALGALNNEVTVSSEGAGTVNFEIDTGTLSGTVVAEATLDDTNWFGIDMVMTDNTIVSSLTAFGVQGSLSYTGWSQVRLRVSAYTSGTSNARIEASKSTNVIRLGQALPAGDNNIGNVDIASLPNEGQQTMANSISVAIASDQGDITIADGGNTITVDGTVTANLSATDNAVLDNIDADATTIAAGYATEGSALGSGVLIQGDDGTDRTNVLVDTSGHLQVDVVTGTVDLGATDNAVLDSIDTNTTTTAAAVATEGSALGSGVLIQGDDGTDRTNVLVDTAGHLQIDIVSGTVTADAGSGTFTVDLGSNNDIQGQVAHDAAVSGNPVLIAVRANTDEPATAVAVGDSTHVWGDTFGRIVTLIGHGDPEPPATASGSTANFSVIAAPGASLSLYIMKGSVHNSNASPQVATLKDGSGGTTLWTAELAAEGGGALFDFGSRGCKLSANTALFCGATAANVYVNVTEYYIAAS